MDTFISNEYAKLQETITDIEVTSENKLQLAERSYCATQESLQHVKDFILDYDFKDQLEEIRFFKEIKPMFLKELIYYQKLFYIEADKPPGGKDALISYYQQAIKRVNDFFERTYILYLYYRLRRSDNDERYFVRTAAAPEVLPE